MNNIKVIVPSTPPVYVSLSQGISGWSGYSGYSGYSGFSGYSGYSGISGYSGYSGFSGYSGYSGVIGLTPFSEGGNDTNTVLLLHGDETPIVDSELTPKALVAASATYSTAQKVFGTGSILFVNTSSQSVRFASSTDFDFGTGDCGMRLYGSGPVTTLYTPIPGRRPI